MSAKTCQLCGKPLGRMRSDGDFCSSEHRNQFRLRRGMDRLEEANKVANLMRRRETPRQIPTAHLLAAGARESRAVWDAAAFPARAVQARFGALAPRLLEVRVVDKPSRFCSSFAVAARKSSPAANRDATPASLPFVVKSAAPVLGAVKARRRSASVAAAGLASMLRSVPPAEGNPRESSALLRVSRSAVSRAGQFQIAASGSSSLHHTHRPQPLAPPLVSAAAGESKAARKIEFQKRGLALRSRASRPGPAGELTRCRRREGVGPAVLDHVVAPRLCTIPPVERAVRPPHLAAHPSVTGARQGQAAHLQPSAYPTVTPPMQRCSLVGWEAEGCVSVSHLRSRNLPSGSVCGRDHLPLKATRTGATGHRPAEVRFAPVDSTFDLAPIALHGSFGAASGEAARPEAETIEEHFNSGLEQWTGDTADWRLDAAGARPAGLALLRPTLALADYEFEFFTRIEARAMTFVFRASNVSNYLKVTIAMVESGRYELRRCAVIGGVEEPAAAAPLPGVLRPGAAFTVKVRAWQNDFTIWLDGETAARWTDGRLPAGGIGFLAPRDDRARVYWVRLSQPDNPNSQAASRRPVRSIQ